MNNNRIPMNVPIIGGPPGALPLIPGLDQAPGPNYHPLGLQMVVETEQGRAAKTVHFGGITKLEHAAIVIAAGDPQLSVDSAIERAKAILDACFQIQWPQRVVEESSDP